MDANRRDLLTLLIAAPMLRGQAESAAERHFQAGMRWLHSFEYDDAREEFIKVREADPAHTLAYWGEALSHTEFIWFSQDLDAGRAALNRLAPTAAARQTKARTARERDYLMAAEALYGPGDYPARTFAFEEAMRQVVARHPADLDAAALLSLAILGTAHRGRDFAIYMRAAAVAEEVYARDPSHPGALHYLIHCYDDPVHAPLGLRAARRYASVAPEAAHALHMPSHIFVAMGMWDDVVSSNEASWNASVARVIRRKLGIEERSYHALYWLEYAYLQQGRYREARQLVDLMAKDAAATDLAYLRYHLALMSAAWVAETGDGVGLPQKLNIADIDAPAASAYLYARGTDALRRKDKAAAAQSVAAIRRLQRHAHNEHEHGSAGLDRVPEVTALQLEGLISNAIPPLQQAARIEDSLPFEFGPPLPVKPAHELLGDVLLRSGQAKLARAHYAKALARTPGKAAALDGLARAIEALGDPAAAEAIKAELRSVRRRADR